MTFADELDSRVSKYEKWVKREKAEKVVRDRENALQKLELLIPTIKDKCIDRAKEGIRHYNYYLSVNDTLRDYKDVIVERLRELGLVIEIKDHDPLVLFISW